MTIDGYRVAVIAHVFYPEVWPEIRCAIEKLCNAGGGGVKVFITISECEVAFSQTIKSELPDSDISVVKNVGWDVWPFFSVLNRLNLDDWDVIVKLHTKRDIAPVWINFRPFIKPNGWRKAALSFCADSRSARKIFEAFQRNAKLGMVAAERVTDPFGLGMRRSLDGCARYLKDMDLSLDSWAAVWGTMWATRAELLSPMWRRWNENDFVAPEAKNLHAGYGLAGDCEILFGAVICAQGYYISSASFPGMFGRFRYALKTAAFWMLRNTLDILKSRPGNLHN